MIVPFLFSFDEYSKNKPTYQWVAYKFYDFCNQNKFPLILEEKYTKSNSYYTKKNHSATSEKMQKDFDYKILPDENAKQIDSYIITDEEEKEILKNYTSLQDAAIELLKKRDSIFERIIEDKILAILEKYQEKIEAIITWVWYPSLDSVAKKYNIPIINYELSTIRPGKYRMTLGYFKFGNKYNCQENLKEIQQFSNQYPDFLLSRKEIINLFIDDEHIIFTNEMDKNPKYEVGMALGLKNDAFIAAYDNRPYKKTLKQLEKYVSPQMISVRSHPASPVDESKYPYSFDHSFESIEWITNCKNILCSVSNIGYETILFDRGIISTNDKMITSFGIKSHLDFYDPKHYGLLELNYLTFGYYVPYELMFDLSYIRFRLKEKDIFKIYQYHLDFILKKYHLSLTKMKKMSMYQRLEYILSTHDIGDSLKQEIMNYAFYHNLEESRKEKIMEDYKKVETELHNVLNSKGWKMLEKLRGIKSNKR